MSQTENTGPIIMSTDGACLGNPGKGGYGVIIRRPNVAQPQKISKGFQMTTNNRMEIMAVLTGLEAVPSDEPVTVRSDSQYVINAIKYGWAKKWRDNGWMRNQKDKALNPDLWEHMLNILEARKAKTEFVWVKGHSGDPDNTEADRLASKAAKEDFRRADEGYLR